MPTTVMTPGCETKAAPCLQLAPAQAQAVSALIAQTLGLAFPAERQRELENGLRSAARALGFGHDVAGVGAWLLSAPLTKEQLHVLAEHLTIGETYFFRQHEQFDFLENTILPDVLARHARDKQLRVWSAGCSTGEEAYSLAIALQRTIPDWHAWRLTILATDLNAAAIQKATAALYGEWSFRDAPAWLKSTCFAHAPADKLRVLDALRHMVTFATLNLIADPYPALINNTTAMDIILCRNVMMYFAPEQMHSVLARLYLSLVEGGWLLVGPTDISGVLRAPVPFAVSDHLTCFKKSSGPVAAPVPAAHSVRHTAPPPPPVAPPPAPRPAAQASMAEAVAAAEAALAGGDFAAVAALLKAPVAATHAQRGETWYTALVLLARAAANGGTLHQALYWCDQAIAARATDVRAHYLRATILLEQGDLVEAAATLRRVLFLHPHHALGHFTLGTVARMQQAWPAAHRHFLNALEVLGALPAEACVPDGDGMTAGRLAEIISAMMTPPACHAA
ncbi:MAG: chemotaxis protein CheR [bacterium]|nr:chemotaxis protein CheR [bacterium]